MMNTSNDQMRARLPLSTYEEKRVAHAYDAERDFHHIRYLESSRETVEEWARLMTLIYDGLTEQDTVRLMLDERASGALPLTYAINRGVRWANSLAHHPKSRLAYMFADHKIAPLGNAMMAVVQRQIKHLTVRLFAPHQEAQAIAWLTDPNWPAKK
jgi:hypothetical protein